MALLLFDVDGTLITGLGPYIPSLEQAIREEFKRNIQVNLTTMHGFTDRKILSQILQENAIGFDRSNIDRCLQRFGKIYQADPKKTTLIPDVKETIPELWQQNTLGLVTGNVEEMARKKLRLFDVGGMKLNDYFRFGCFGKYSCERSHLVAYAYARAGQWHRDWKDSPAYVIGDTPKDIEAALDAAGNISEQIIPIGVTTGNSTREQLQQARAHYVIDSLTELSSLI